MTIVFWLIALFCMSLIYYIKTNEQWCILLVSIGATFSRGLYESSVDNFTSDLLRMFIRMDRSLYDGNGTGNSY